MTSSLSARDSKLLLLNGRSDELFCKDFHRYVSVDFFVVRLVDFSKRAFADQFSQNISFRDLLSWRKELVVELNRLKLLRDPKSF